MLLPLLYFIGWLTVQPLRLINSKIPQEDLALFGTILTFVYFCLIIPHWVKVRWKARRPWAALGFFKLSKNYFLVIFWRGLSWALLLISAIGISVWVGSWGVWIGDLKLDIFINAIALGIGVGLAEELIFRGWLLEEMNLIFGFRWGIFIQAAIFSLSHTPFSFGVIGALSVSFGLFLLGIVLAIRKRLDGGSLISCISLHGGLVGIWFLLNEGLISLLPNTPSLLFGPGGLTPNPIGGLIAIVALLWTIWFHRTAFAIAREPWRGARNASSNGATP
ncbi:CPBP family intramembrane glutamic endopeptidase [Prochlorococcus marinus]|uniref:CAAX prenyl protease 2/Lysostaphin resistance protein A-like domain-containing protein n=1 Tax=Prochlorococcus marinus (strain MIT 9211) TaxID=93059 RepID=A9BCI9_PROM4|nr:type II CAAX endopeptidase family protein [Prochlorococcus marinus]ABX09551.1 Hypothetical protein P9211_16201 [Prochlorococcus marinus str. MIT 9211]